MDYKRMTFYQIYPRSFCDSNGDGIGDIQGIISKLDYIKSLGVDGIWFSPLYCSPNSDYGYDISDYRNINPEYGSMEDFNQLLSEMHSRGLKCIMDLVINHTSSQHQWFVESQKSKDNPYRDYYIWQDGKGKDGKRPPNNWTSFFLGKAWKYDKHTKQWYLHLFDENQPDLNYKNPKVLAEIKEILKYWLDKGVDGFRCDVITLLDKTDGYPNGKGMIALVGKEHYIDNKGMPDILRSLRKDVLDHYDTFTVGESVMINVDTALRYISEKDMLLNTIFAFDHMSCDNYFGIKQFVRKFNLNILKQANKRWQNGLYGKGWNTLYFENHDQARIVGRYCSDSSQFRVVGAKMLATIEMTLSGTPFVYEGQEIGMTSIRMADINDYQDVESHRSYATLTKIMSKKAAMKKIAYCSRDNARTPMQWNTSASAGFTSGKPWLKINPNYTEINAQSQQNDPDSVLNYYRKLIQLRHTHDEMVFGTYTLINYGGKSVYAYLREYQDKKLLVVTNFTQKNRAVKLSDLKLANAQGELFVGNYKDAPIKLSDLTLRPYEAVVYSLK